MLADARRRARRPWPLRRRCGSASASSGSRHCPRASTVCSMSSTLKPVARPAAPASQHLGAPDVGRLEDRQPVVDGLRGDALGDDRLDLVARREPARRLVAIGRELRRSPAGRRAWRSASSQSRDSRPSPDRRRRAPRDRHARCGSSERFGSRRPSLRCVVSTSNWKSTSASSRLVSTWLPLPVMPRRTSAARMPCAAGGAGQHVGDRQAERHRPLVLVAVQPHHAGARLRQQILARPRHPRPLFAIAGDRGIDDARIDLPAPPRSRGRAAR